MGLLPIRPGARVPGRRDGLCAPNQPLTACIGCCMSGFVQFCAGRGLQIDFGPNALPAISSAPLIRSLSREHLIAINSADAGAQREASFHPVTKNYTRTRFWGTLEIIRSPDFFTS